MAVGIEQSTKVICKAVNTGLAVARLSVGRSAASAQPAPRAFDAYQSIGQTDLNQTRTATRLKAARWTDAPAEPNATFGQDIFGPKKLMRRFRDALGLWLSSTPINRNTQPVEGTIQVLLTKAGAL